jgi:hypothetical protein
VDLAAAVLEEAAQAAAGSRMPITLCKQKNRSRIL